MLPARRAGPRGCLFSPLGGSGYAPGLVTPDDIKQLRKELNCTARELATALKIDQKEVLAWESGELFPTKRYVTMMELFRKKGPSAIPKAPRGKSKKVGVERLDDPKLWEIVRKLIMNPPLFDQVLKLSEAYSDPARAEAPKEKSEES
jgi:transcriptional regulator with XRE-family HTH domain